jgi:hypothetical protein
VYITYGTKEVGAVILKDDPELFLGMSADASVVWSFMGSTPAYILEIIFHVPGLKPPPLGGQL